MKQSYSDRELGWWLTSAPGWGAVKLRQLLAVWDTPQLAVEAMDQTGEPSVFYERMGILWEMSEQYRMGERLRITQADVNRLWTHRSRMEICGEQYGYWKERGVRFVTCQELIYPKRLRTIYDYPYGLFVRGNLPVENRPTAAVIGARACSPYGAGMGHRIAGELAGHGVQIISGLACGVDSEGHWGALESGVFGSTYAVLGCGVDQCYPRENIKLAERILENGGGLISEYPPGTEPLPGHFPMRNRIISGLSDCILIMEARKKSGSLITADQALEQGRDVFALPGRVGDALSEGCHQLIRHGAGILTGSGDVLESLFPGKQWNGEWIKGSDADTDTAAETEQIFRCMDITGKSLDELMYDTGLPFHVVQGQVLELLLEGRVREISKGFFARKI